MDLFSNHKEETLTFENDTGYSKELLTMRLKAAIERLMTQLELVTFTTENTLTVSITLQNPEQKPKIST